MNKRDRQGVRTPAGLEQKYSFGKVFSNQAKENARQNSEMDQQRMTMQQFISYASSSIDTLNKNIETMQKSLTALSKKDEELDKTDDRLEDLISTYWKTVYPVGAIYVSVSESNPSTIFGGTWERIRDRFLLAAGSTYEAGSTGGEAEHTLTEDEMPSHRHPIGVDGSKKGVSGAGIASGSGYFALGASYDNLYALHSGGSQPHNNMPPYLAVYVWKRTA